MPIPTSAVPISASTLDLYVGGILQTLWIEGAISTANTQTGDLRSPTVPLHRCVNPSSGVGQCSRTRKGTGEIMHFKAQI